MAYFRNVQKYGNMNKMPYYTYFQTLAYILSLF